MLMIPHAHPPARPRLTPTRIERQHDLARAAAQARLTKHLLARAALVPAQPGLQHLLTALAGLAAAPIRRAPGDEAVALDGLGAGAFEFDAEFAEEARVPVVLMGFEQAVGFLVGEEVQDEGAERGGVADGVVEDPGVARGGDGVGGFGQAGEGGEDMVAQRRGEEAVGEGVEVEEEEVFGTALGVAQVAVAAEVVLGELRQGVHGGKQWGGGGTVANVVAAGDRRLERAGVEPLEEPFEDFRLFFRESDRLIHAFGKCAVQCCSEERRGGRKQFLVHEILCFRAELTARLSHQHRGEA